MNRIDALGQEHVQEEGFTKSLSKAGDMLGTLVGVFGMAGGTSPDSIIGLPCRDKSSCKASCTRKWLLCKAAGFAAASSCRQITRSGCIVSCAGSGPGYALCVTLCIASGEAGCGMTGLLVSKTCDAIRDRCLQGCTQ